MFLKRLSDKILCVVVHNKLTFNIIYNLKKLLSLFVYLWYGEKRIFFLSIENIVNFMIRRNYNDDFIFSLMQINFVVNAKLCVAHDLFIVISIIKKGIRSNPQTELRWFISASAKATVPVKFFIKWNPL